MKNNPLRSFARLIVAHPSIAGCTTAVAVTFTLIAVNALWFQPVKHPSPLFSTRDMVVTGATRTAEAVIPKAHKLVAPLAGKSANAERTGADVLRELQLALEERGYYQGAIDGIYGSRTATAIKGFQSQHNLAEDGKPSAKLLTRILMAPTAKVPDGATATTQSPATGQDNTAVATPEKLVAEIQSGLRNYGYDEVVVDGLLGSQTSNAIRRFQLDYGLDITGEPSEALLKKLVDIGAIQRG